MIRIETNRLLLVPATKQLLEAALVSNLSLSECLKANVDDNWTEFGRIIIEYVLDRLNENPAHEGWWTYFPVYKETNTLIGSGGYKGAPNANGVVEIGYEIAPAYRNRGLATEFVQGLITHAFSFKEVKTIAAHTLAEINPSTRLLKACGFVKTQDLTDPEEGTLWRWELNR